MRSSQRRNSQQDGTPGRTRAGRGAKPAPSKTELPDSVPPKASPTKLSPGAQRKPTRSGSNISQPSFEAAGDVYASYERPLLMVFGLSPEFFAGLRKHHGKLPKDRKVLIGSLPLPESALEDEETSESDDDTMSESELDDPPIAAQPTSRGRGRGRGGRGGGRGRGGRGRGRGRGRGAMASIAHRGWPVEYSAYADSEIGDDDDGGVSNMWGSPTSSSMEYESRLPTPSISPSMSSGEEEPEPSDDESDISIRLVPRTPRGSPPAKLQETILNGTYKATSASEPSVQPTAKTSKKLAVPKISFTKGSGTQTPLTSASTPAESAAPQILDPDEDMLSDSDLPGPWIDDAPSPLEADCEDRGDYLLQKRYPPMIDVQDLISRLNKYNPAQRSTESLYALAQNTQYILKAWQDEYLKLDARTAPHMHPPKKAANGGRIPLAPDVFEGMKEADLYGYNYDPKKAPDAQDPWAQRPGAEKGNGRELRTRRTRDMLDSAAPSEEDGEGEENDGRPSKRQRRATRRFDGTDTGTNTGTNTPKKNNGWGGARKKGVSRFSKPASETPEPEGRPTKRARITASNLLHQRIQEMREASLIPSSGEEDSAMDVDEYSDTNVKRGRPPGSKNVARRSDYGIKKGPRKKTSEAGTPVPSAHGPNAPPPALQSMVEGQGQFTLDPQAASADSTPPLGANPAENVFQAAPQPLSAKENASTQPEQASTPDSYMITAPLSQYTGAGGYVEETSPASGSRRKPRVKSEKRSQSMTIWWAERKARKREQDEKNGTPVKLASSARSNSQSGRRGGRISGVSATPATPSSVPSDSSRPSSMHHADHPQPPPEAYTGYQPQHPPAAPSPLYMYASAPPQPHPLMLPYSPLAALPSGSYSYSTAPPPPSSQYPARALAPAPAISQPQSTYPSPYGPQSPPSSRPKSSGQPLRSGPPPLAPAPSHYTPYPSMDMNRDHAFKVMIPGPPASEPRRGSR